ncbi:RNA exonuclease 3 [Fulvia fulva]|uniref:RNA exonuclease 3 n=1 Tax=Passalora fulva TaxID=5499 RepID=A0A9Q8L5L0_PASFU|nr:RNA exonuclease 3 [Fulvia fulva]KAK4634711.1 RNA exonuclease 3 [Fulvia fulva]KAK4638148.1 RNA exonuclease 3 [Fulvia fulva]UJO11232.1 RNA exonuclease 3 [Fulvia fulva]WPV09697.1 RNA exonuclease 3 [Fulvia fulva]WPV24907.1 RNA exonuclease 3 [Fulvia fulva]
MVFSTTNLFKGIACPKGEKCDMTCCIYAHDERVDVAASQPTLSAAPTHKAIDRLTQSAHDFREPAAKRRKITYDRLQDKPPSRADLIRKQLAAVKSKPPETSSREDARGSKTGAVQAQPPSSLAPPVSPPPKRSTSQHDSTSAANSEPGKVIVKGPDSEKVETLNPRLIANDPVGHSKRSAFLKRLHQEMAKLNSRVAAAANVDFKAVLHLSEQQLIKLALGEEEKVVSHQPQVYTNVIKQRIASLMKMSVEDWIKDLKPRIVIPDSKPSIKGEKLIDTGLPLEQEHLILPQLVADQKPLAAFGYVPEPPTIEQAAEAAAAVEASQNWEICDRCTARFQIFPDRDEKGRLSSNGPCRHHPNRKVFPPRSKTDKETGDKQPYFPCCTAAVGEVGCTESPEHVFKTSSPARLAATMPFIKTPENEAPSRDRRDKKVNAVTFDCEMGHTTMGLELIRLTAVTWPAGEPLLDILVRPLGAVMDLNSRFSGVFPEHFADAIPYDQWLSSPPPPPRDDGASPALPIVDSPQRARELLCGFITPTTPLIGHAIDNDLNTVRLCHPTIIDTVILYPHPRGLPMRFGLKMLSQRYLQRAIQTGGLRGHDSLEDAVATGDLVRVKVREKWKQLRSSGWSIVNDQLLPPPPRKPSVEEAGMASAEQHAKDMVGKALHGTKRKKRPSTDSSEAEDGH